MNRMSLKYLLVMLVRTYMDPVANFEVTEFDLTLFYATAA